MKKVFLAAALLFSPLVFGGDEVIDGIFTRQGVDGTMLVSSMRGGKTFIHNETRASERFPAASTFKVFNTLIGLEEKVITGKESLFKWDGQQHSFPDWNQDQTLESAFKVSCVWCFQQLASQVGAVKYRNYISQAGYGKLASQFDATTFWLDGSLKISAFEQVEFLKKIYRRSLPYQPASYDILDSIMLVETAPKYKFFAKTGWAARASPQVGWYVGYVETSDDVWVFATNITIRQESDLQLRQQLTRDVLKAKGIIQQ